MRELLQIQDGNTIVCSSDDAELIHGIEYLKTELTESEKDIIRFLYALTGKYHLTHKPLDKLLDPHAPIILPNMEHTILKPELAVYKNEGKVPAWIVEVANTEKSEITYLLKTNIYANLGVEEYWIIDDVKKVIVIYNFEKNDYVPCIYDTPRRIKVGIYKDFFISFSDIFKNRMKS